MSWRRNMKDFSSWNRLDIPVSGITEKVWLTDEYGVRKGLFKFGEEWTEEIAKDLAALFKIPCMECEYGTYRGLNGVMCYRKQGQAFGEFCFGLRWELSPII